MRWYFLDRITECDPGKSLRGVKCFTRSELFFMDHFHGHPIVPGVLLIEAVATSGGKAIKVAHPNLLPMLAKVEKAKFYNSVGPGDQCQIEVQIDSLRQAYALAHGKVTVDNRRVCEVSLMYTLQSAEIADTSWKDPVIAEWLAKGKSPMAPRGGEK
jgi:3-hydroxyacyl-[acyl-carrier-protein] dehydratase